MKNHQAFEYHAPQNPSSLVILCDHASNFVPDWVNQGDLGLSREDMARHIAYDVGAYSVAKALSQKFDAHFVASCFSRLVIDPNRSENDPTLIMQVYDRSVIPANRDLAPNMRQERIEKLYRPYHEEIARVIDLASQNGDIAVISIHSFTHQLQGKPPRPWHIGILSADDRRLADPVIAQFEADGRYIIGDNEPYKGALAGDTMEKHCLRHGLPHILIEVRNDLIADEKGQGEWAQEIFQALKPILNK